MYIVWISHMNKNQNHAPISTSSECAFLTEKILLVVIIDNSLNMSKYLK